MVATAAAPGGGRQDHPPRLKSDLSLNGSRLVELMQDINFGRIEGLVIEGGLPSFDPPPRIVREVKFGGENGPRPELGANDFLLKQHVIDLFTFFGELQNAVIDVLEIKHGLPFRVSVEDAA